MASWGRPRRVPPGFPPNGLGWLRQRLWGRSWGLVRRGARVHCMSQAGVLSGRVCAGLALSGQGPSPLPRPRLCGVQRACGGCGRGVAAGEGWPREGRGRGIAEPGLGQGRRFPPCSGLWEMHFASVITHTRQRPLVSTWCGAVGCTPGPGRVPRHRLPRSRPCSRNAAHLPSCRRSEPPPPGSPPGRSIRGLSHAALCTGSPAGPCVHPLQNPAAFPRDWDSVSLSVKWEEPSGCSWKERRGVGGESGGWGSGPSPPQTCGGF